MYPFTAGNAARICREHDVPCHQAKMEENQSWFLFISFSLSFLFEGLGTLSKATP